MSALNTEVPLTPLTVDPAKPEATCNIRVTLTPLLSSAPPVTGYGFRAPVTAEQAWQFAMGMTQGLTRVTLYTRDGRMVHHEQVALDASRYTFAVVNVEPEADEDVLPEPMPLPSCS